MGTKFHFFRGRGVSGRLHMLAAAALCGCSVAAAQAAPATAQAISKAIILRPLSFFLVQDMNLGTIVPGATAGTVRLYPNGTRTATGGVTLTGASHQPARFAGLGTFNEQVSISISAASIPLTGPGPSMILSQFEIGSTPTAILSPTPTFFTIGSTIGAFNFPVGGQLAVGANQTAGTYTGTFTITLNYL